MEIDIDYRAKIVVEYASLIATTVETYKDFSNAIYGTNGVVNSLFPTPAYRAQFRESPRHQLLRQIIEDMMRRAPAGGEVHAIFEDGQQVIGDETHEPSPSPGIAAYLSSKKIVDRWSAAQPPTGRGYPIDAATNELRCLYSVLDGLAQDGEIMFRGVLTGKHMLVPMAVDQLIRGGVEFKNINWAIGCIKNKVEEIANSGGQIDPRKMTHADRQKLEATAAMAKPADKNWKSKF